MKLVIGLLVGAFLGGTAMFVLVDRDEISPLPPRTTTFPTPTALPEPTPSRTADGVVRGCLAALLPPKNPELTNRGLPAAVDVMRKQILGAAVVCDYRELDRLALAGRPYFSYSFGVEKNPASFWRARDRDARRMDRPELSYLSRLVQILHLPYCTESQDDGTGTDTEAEYYVWPRVHCSDRTAEDWNDLEGLYSDDEIERMRRGDIYYGHRVGILADGDWVYFIAGD